MKLFAGCRVTRPGSPWFLALGAALLAAPLAAQAQGLPNFDIQKDSRGTTLTGSPTARAAALARTPGLQVKFEALTGTANRVSNSSGFLTGPSRLAPETVSRRFVADHPELYHLKDAEVAALYTEHQAFTESMGVTNLELGQQLNGIPVFKAGLKLHVSDQGELLTTSGAVVPQLGRSVTATVPRLGPGQALAFAARHAGLKSGNLGGQLTPPQGARAAVQFACGDLFEREPVVQLSYFPVAKGKTALAWDTVLWLNSSSDVYHILVDASTGALLFRNNYTAHASGTVFAKEAPQSQFPFTTSPGANIARVSKPFDGTDPFFGTALYAAGDPHINWWAGAAPASTDGNNCLAGSARTFTFPEGTAKPTAVAGASGVFNFPVDLTQDPTTYQNAAVANLFYWNNRCHDIWYKFGFTEAFRNFQNNNFGLGGVGNDATVAMAQYDANGDSRNNANFSTPSDGTNGRMRMFVFDITNPQRDGDFSADVIVHEYGHGLTNRIIGNANGLDADQSGAMGEGWGDFQGLMILVEPTDNLAADYPIGGYVINDFAAGIRNQPYSTSGQVFDETYGQIDTIGGRPFEVHNAGEVMCNALWQTHGRICARLGATAGRLRMMQLFINGLKLTPSNPTFLDHRNALVQADQQTFAGADVADIWAAFASRGMGVSATTTGPNDHNPVEAFDTPAIPVNIKGRVTQGTSGLAGVTMTAVLPGATATTLNLAPHVAIPDSDDTGVTSTANVTQTGTVGSVGVHVDITHTFAGDLKVTLIHPDGTRAVLRDQTGGSEDNIHQDFTVTGFSGKPRAGAWKLLVQDLSFLDTGTLDTWSLSLAATAGATKTATTGADGTYTIANVSAGTHTVTPTKTGVTFTPANRSVTVTTSDAVNVDFAAGGGTTTFSVSGTITQGAAGLAGVTVTGGGKTATTDTAGLYTLSGLAAGTYTVTPAKSGFTFTPANRSVTITSANVTGQNFAGTPTGSTFSITGSVLNRTTGAAVPNVRVTAGAFTATTNTSGVFTLAGLPAGAYTVAPQASATANFAFSPGSRSVTVGPNATGVKFGASPAFSISGKVTRSTGAALAGATVKATGTTQAALSAAGGGGAIPDNNTTGLTSTLAIAGTPTTAKITSAKVAVNITHPFRGDLSVTLVHPSGTSVVLYNGPRGDGTANLNVSFPDQMAPVGSLSTLNTKAVNGSWKLVVKDLAGGDVGTLVSWSLSLTYSQGVTVQTTTDSVGNYVLAGLLPATYVVQPVVSGRTFTPASLSVTVGPNATGKNFVSGQP